MAGKKVDVEITTLSDLISEMKSMKASWRERPIEDVPVSSGSGKTNELLKQIVDKYELIYKETHNLADNTIQFLENVEKSLRDVDTEISNQISQSREENK